MITVVISIITNAPAIAIPIEVPTSNTGPFLTTPVNKQIVIHQLNIALLASIHRHSIARD